MMTDDYKNPYQDNAKVEDNDVVAIFFIESDSYPEQLALASKFASNDGVSIAFTPTGLQLFIPLGVQLTPALPVLSGDTAIQVTDFFADYCGCAVFVEYMTATSQQDLDLYNGEFFVVPEEVLERRRQDYLANHYEESALSF